MANALPKMTFNISKDFAFKGFKKDENKFI